MKDLIKFVLFIQFIALLVCFACWPFAGFDIREAMIACAIVLVASLAAPVLGKLMGWWMDT